MKRSFCHRMYCRRKKKLSATRKEENVTAIIDYDAGNIKSVEKALQALGEEAVITRDGEKILNADHVCSRAMRGRFSCIKGGHVGSTHR